MEHIITRRRGFRKLLAFLLCMASILGLLPAQAFAMSVGQTASSWLGDQYVGSDGNHYRAPAPYTYLAYHADGTIDVHTSSGGNAYRHYMLTDSDGISHQVYCVESGIPYHTSENTYVSESGTNSQYLNLLPAEARRGITLTAIYGWKPGATLPVSGINEDDYKMATQIILWEYQQQLRSDPYNRHGNGHADGDQYFSVIAGRPAEKAYDWILAQVASHSTVPSFTSSKKSEAPELELKWDVEKKVYTLTVTDTNNLKIDLEALKGSGVSVTRNGNEYTFTSRQMMMDPVLFEFRKNIPVANDMLIWGRPGYQTMMTGASDPVSFFVKIKTETYGTAKLVKTSEDGIVSGITFHISGTDILGNEVNEEVTTGENGQIEKKLLPGTYLVKELPVDRYVTPSAQYVTIESGQTSSVHFSNKDAYRDLAGYVEVPEQTASPESAPDPTEPKRDDADIVLPSVDFETLRENGPDIIGWLSLPDTVLNYPVTHTDNNEYYLNHLYDGTYNKVGCLFADYENRADFSDRNTIIYGHNMRDGSMFALLNRYDEQSYFDTHRQMYLVTPKGGYVMEIFTAFAAKPEESGSKTSPWQLSWKDDGAYTTWLTAMKERSAVESDVTVTCSDKVLTLSTCTPGGTGRFLVMGKLVKVDNEI